MVVIADINKNNRKFWSKHNKETSHLLEYPSFLEKALELAVKEQREGVPPMHQRRLDLLLRDALQPDWEKRRWRAQASARFPKSDELQKIIEEIVRKYPLITTEEVLKRLSEQAGIGTIQDIDSKSIFFTIGDGSTKIAPLSGLKDRVTRARKKAATKSRKAPSR